MAVCPPQYTPLGCGLSGKAYLSQALDTTETTAALMQGHGAYLPAPPAGQFFYAVLTNACGDCCEEVRVVANAGDVLTIQRINPTCCFPSNSSIEYSSCGKNAILAIASEAPVNVVPPLVWDCETRTLSLDCEVLFDTLVATWLQAGSGVTGDVAALAQQVSANTQAIAGNTATLGTMATDAQFTALQATVTTQGNTLATQQTSLNNLSTALTSKASNQDLANVQAQASAASADVANMTSAVNTNTQAIANAVTDIATNTADISANTTQLSNNTADIAANTTQLATNTANIATNTAQIATNTADIAALQTP